MINKSNRSLIEKDKNEDPIDVSKDDFVKRK